MRSSFLKHHRIIRYSLFAIAVIFVFFCYQRFKVIENGSLCVSEEISRRIGNVKVTNNWILPADHPYVPLLNKNVSHRLNKEVLSFLGVSRFRAFPHRYNQVFMELLIEFDRIWRKKLGQPYVIFAGTLLGAIRHGSWLPYDDDLDVIIDINLKRKLKKAFRESRLRILETKNPVMLYFDDRRTLKTPTASWPNWPFLDVFFYEQDRNDSTAFIESAYKNKIFAHEMFPVVKLSFNKHKFPAPRCPITILKRLYGNPLKTCCVHAHNHRTDTSTGSACTECAKLATVFPYLKWSRINSTHMQSYKSLPPPDHEEKSVTWRPHQTLLLPKC